MPNYLFGMPEQIQRIIDMMERTNNQPNNAVAAAQQSSAQTQEPLQSQVAQNALQNAQRAILNGEERRMAEDIINAKIGYGTADNKDVQRQTGLNADQLRDFYNKSAENIRTRASGAGFDLSGYGSGVKLEDAYRNLQSNDARARVEALTQGPYAMSAEEFFDAKYLELFMKGYSPRQAKKFAGDMAQHYQADRVAYLRGMFNGYGRNGNYVNDFGVDILNSIATENPAVSMVYSTAYQFPTNAQERANQIEDKQIALVDELAKLGVINNNALKLTDRQAEHNLNYQERGAKLSRETHAINEQNDTNILFAYQKRLSELQNAQEKQAYAEKAELLAQQLKALGLAGEDFKAAWAKGMGIPYPSKETPQFNKEIVGKAIDQYGKLIEEEKNILTALQNVETPEEIQRVLKNRLQVIQQYKDNFDNVLGKGFGIELGQSPTAFTGDFAKDHETVTKTILPFLAKINPNASKQEIVAAIRDWTGGKATDDYIKRLISAETRTVSEAVKQGLFK